MKLQIQNTLGTYEVIGNFTSDNTQKVKDQFNYLLDHYQEVVLSLDKVNRMDKKAVQVLDYIYHKALKRSKILFVLGKENPVAVQALTTYQRSYIFRHDY